MSAATTCNFDHLAPNAESFMALQAGRIQKTILGILLASLLMTVSLAVGCNDGRPKRVPVSGQVLIDGTPVPGGSIRFVPEGARPAAAELDSEGRFTLRCYDGEDGAVIGVHRVQVAARVITDEESVKWFAPKEYSDFRSSGLTVEISEPIDDLVIQLSWGGKKPRGR